MEYEIRKINGIECWYQELLLTTRHNGVERTLGTGMMNTSESLDCVESLIGMTQEMLENMGANDAAEECRKLAFAVSMIEPEDLV